MSDRTQCLITGGADGKIMVWDVHSGQRMHVLNGQTDSMMAVQDLAVDPVASSVASVVVVSASSDPVIRQWRISLDTAAQIPPVREGGRGEAAPVANQHETSVYQVLFPDMDEDPDLWTASADGTAKCLARARDWASEDTFAHGDYVRAIAVTERWVVTAGRDEHVKVWERSSGQLWHVYVGHYEEVTGLIICGQEVVSVSIDGTLRRWSLDEEELAKARREEENRREGRHIEEEEEKEKPRRAVLTAEEEAELAELMEE